MRLTIIRIKPNPAGKDRPGHGGPTAAQLAAEWVDFRNDTGHDVALDGVSLWHLTYAPGRDARVGAACRTSPARCRPARSLRVHAGQKRDLSVIRAEDMAGADYHVFTGDDAYVWNNKQGDSPLLYKEAAKATIDKASYAPQPARGRRAGAPRRPARSGTGARRQLVRSPTMIKLQWKVNGRNVPANRIADELRQGCSG